MLPWKVLGLFLLGVGIAVAAVPDWGTRSSSVPDSAPTTTLVSDANDYAKTTFPIDVKDWGEERSDGGIVAADLNGDQQLDFVITQPDRIVAYDQQGNRLWRVSDPDIQLSGQAEREGLPGLHGAGVQVGDVDGDGTAEVLYVDRSNHLHILNGETGEIDRTIRLPEVESQFDRWEHAIIANFRGAGDVDVLLQASQAVPNRSDYYRDTQIAAFTLADLIQTEASAKALWSRDNFVAASHNPGLVTDITGDGRDEVLGGMILSSTGELLTDLGIGNRDKPHIDSVAVGDIVPDRPGLEVVVPVEDGGNPIYLFDEDGVIFESTAKAGNSDGDKVQIGDFDPSREGLEMWFRGKESDNMWVLDAQGNKIADYDFDEQSPNRWTDSGIEEIHRIRWTGDRQEHIAGKERHESGDVGIFDPMTGQNLLQVRERTDRFYVADVAGDWREEMIVISGDQLSIYQNTNPNPNPNQPRLWEDSAYRRRKMTWNYYSP